MIKNEGLKMRKENEGRTMKEGRMKGSMEGGRREGRKNKEGKTEGR